MKPYKSKFKESSLSRLMSFIDEYQTGTISAYRSEYTGRENMNRNYKLKSKLLSLGYGVTEVQGVFIENFGTDHPVPVKEQTFFVVDRDNKRNLEKVLRQLGEEWEQDSIMFIPKGGEKSILWGTRLDNNYPPYGKTKVFPIRKIGTSDYEFLTKVGGRPFYFREPPVILDEEYCGNISSRHLASIESR